MRPNWCKHFNGARSGATCLAGVPMDSVRKVLTDEEKRASGSGFGVQWPCTPAGQRLGMECPKLEFPTGAEVREDEEETTRIASAVMAGRCPDHGELKSSGSWLFCPAEGCDLKAHVNRGRGRR